MNTDFPGYIGSKPDPNIKLSILICFIPQRFDSLKILCEKLQSQAEGKPVHIQLYGDNKKITIGEKRTEMVRMARGKYFILIDDDDDCSDDYVDELLKASESDADILSFDQKAIISNAGEGIVNFHLSNENEEFKPGGITRRKPFSVCAFKTEVFKKVSFGNKMYGEDMVFSEQAWGIAQSEYHIDKVLHIYKDSGVVHPAP